MKKILWCVMAMAVMTMFYSCKQNSNVCRIQGVVNGEQFEGKRIFLVPFTGPKSAETVDSMEIKDGKFHFETDSMQMYKILIDLRFRVGIQPLLVIGEPGEVKVVIDSVSHAVGTPQNDSLEKWKVRTEIHNRELSKMRRYIADLQQQGDTVRAKYIQQRADSFHLVYKNYSRQMAENLKEGVLHDFLKDMFPLTYQRKYPDGRVVTMNADTNEEIPE
ncbi:protein of unknown function [Prevotella aff. ruminicola Tc2-24]|jgi:hypothetical protein|uniref:DUF4369 domain-containing protein n=1 Tax=Prevotella aff. ruminicola Tc2-24 TaxID=81582 RepID=A0A1I0QLH4_9BACT|nr:MULTISPECIES: DUF4369 domain-containing protein [Prevotella]SEE56942.1 protein of unknown function [Prevotella sp. lc2012]SEW27574.1 protein of unknown function [Prevotella aff. ruminicola Tc2-24]